MTVHAPSKDVIVLSGRCGVEDAAQLQSHLVAAPACTVDWLACESLHTAVVQVLLVARPRIRGSPANAFLQNHIEPALRAAQQPATYIKVDPA